MARRMFVVTLFCIAAALLLALPCQTGTVTVRCPGGDAETIYYYDLVGERYRQTIRISYIPGVAGTNHATVDGVPLGDYRLLENGEERAAVTVGLFSAHVLVEPDESWPVMPPV